MVSGDHERLLPEPENYVKCFYDLFKSIAEAQRCELRITSFHLCLLDAFGGDFICHLSNSIIPTKFLIILFLFSLNMSYNVIVLRNYIMIFVDV